MNENRPSSSRHNSVAEPILKAAASRLTGRSLNRPTSSRISGGISPTAIVRSLRVQSSLASSVAAFQRAASEAPASMPGG
jgi:hypothetical protein